MEGTSATPQPLWIEQDDLVQLDGDGQVGDPTGELEATDTAAARPALPQPPSRLTGTRRGIAVAAVSVAVAISFGGGLLLAPHDARPRVVITTPRATEQPTAARAEELHRETKLASGTGERRARRVPAA